MQTVHHRSFNALNGFEYFDHTMVKTPKPCILDNFGGWRRPVFHWPPIRSVLVERIVNPILMMVGHVITD